MPLTVDWMMNCGVKFTWVGSESEIISIAYELFSIVWASGVQV